MFTQCFESGNEGILVNFAKWQSKFQKALYACFRKVRVTDTGKNPTKIDELMDEKKNILKQKQITSEEEENINKIDSLISNECSDREFQKLVKVLGELETETGATNSTNIWKEFRKAYPKKFRPVPTGVKNVHGKVV